MARGRKRKQAPEAAERPAAEVDMGQDEAAAELPGEPIDFGAPELQPELDDVPEEALASEPAAPVSLTKIAAKHRKFHSQ